MNTCPLRAARVERYCFYELFIFGFKSAGVFLMKLSGSEKNIVVFATLAGFFLAFPMTASAMHIMEGYLPPVWCAVWGAICVPFVAIGFISIKKKTAASPKSLILLALCGAFAFVLSALKIPSVTGSCSHPTGAGLGAILFGPLVMSVISVIILLFQAILLAHGGVTTLGANTFSMGIAGPILAFAVYKLTKRLGLKSGISVFLAAFVGDIVTYLVTASQLALAFPDNGSVGASLVKFLGVFAFTQLPLAVCEGILTVVVWNILEKYSPRELKAIAGI